MSKKKLVVIVAVVAGAAAAVWAQVGQPGRAGPGSLLRQWYGQNCTLYLRMESDPRAGRNAFNSGTMDGLQRAEDVPMAITGTITGVSDDGITLVNGNTVYWVPRDQIRVIAGILGANP